MLLVRHGESAWNVVFGELRIDTGIADPELTATGREQAQSAAAQLAGQGVERLLASPYRRTLETASIIADTLGLDIEVEPLVRERCAFSCDQGSPPELLRRRWPSLDFTGLEPDWCGRRIESVDALQLRATEFIRRAALDPARERTAVVSHWGFILAATGRSVDNADIVRLPEAVPL